MKRSLRNKIVTTTAVVAAVALNGAVLSQPITKAYTAFQESRPDYIAEKGRWETIELPAEYRVRAIHAALLYSGEVLLVAGSGNNRRAFEAKTFETILWDPVTGATRKVETPEDLFCGGHAYLPNGDLLISGGTAKYEVLADDVKRAAGPIWVKNENGQEVQIRKGDVFSRGNGMTYAATEDVLVPAAKDPGDGTWEPGRANVWVEATEEGKEYATGEDAERLDLDRLSIAEQQNLYAWSNQVNMDKQNYTGLDASYIFDVKQSKYVKTDDMNFARWYPTLVSLNGGNILAVSGLDQHGYILEGQNEIFDTVAKDWHYDGKVDRFFPTYPSLFRLANGRLFYSGSSTGYGVATEGRQPGIWDVSTNEWQDVDGLRDQDMTETSSSVMLAPAQDQRVAIIGGGGVGEDDAATARIDIADLDADVPAYTPGPTYPSPARYVSAVTLPDDKTLLTGGSRYYRGKFLSDLHVTRMLDPETLELIEAAPNHVGRNYHSTAVLLPNGTVMTMGSDPLFGDEHNHTPGKFETRLEIYTPPANYIADRPVISEAPEDLERGTEVTFQVDSVAPIEKVRLIRPSAVTHLTDTEQRSVAAEIVSQEDGSVTVEIPDSEGVLPSGPYMLWAVDDRGAPSEMASWVMVR
jgi:hypothetical protein